MTDQYWGPETSKAIANFPPNAQQIAAGNDCTVNEQTSGTVET